MEPIKVDSVRRKLMELGQHFDAKVLLWASQGK